MLAQLAIGVLGVLLVSGVWDHWMNVLRATFGANTGVGARL
jgi:hypothetical protein